MKNYRAIVASVFFAAMIQAPALAVTTSHGPVWEATYVAAYQSTFGHQGVPFHGTMKLKFNHGIISGTYASDSTRPDPLRGRIVGVSGGVKEGNVTLILSPVSGGFSVRGTMKTDGEISGTATVGGHFYTFMAKVKSTP